MIESLLAVLLIATAAKGGTLTCTPESAGPCVPSDIQEQKKPIMEAVNAALTARDEMNEESLIKVSASAAGDHESELNQWTAARASEDRMKTAANLAIRLSQTVYRFTPPAANDPRAQRPTTHDGDWCANLPAPWTPEFQISRYRAIKGADNTMHYVSDVPDGKTGGITDPDGIVTIFPFAFEWARRIGDPGPLAISIHHELVHYEELITTGWDTHEQGEVRAFKKSRDLTDTFLPVGTISGISIRGLFKRSFQEIIDANQAIIDSGAAHSHFPNEAQEAANKLGVEQQEYDEAAYRSLQAAIDKERRDRSAQDVAAQRTLRWMKFNIWSLYACMYIIGVHEGDPEWGNPDRIRVRDDFYRGYLRNNLVVMPKDEIDAGLKRNDLYHGGDIGRCQEQVVELIRDLPGPVDDNWIMDKIEYDRNGGKAGEIISSVVNSVHRAVVDGTAAIIEIATAPFTADIGSGSGGGANPGNRSGGSAGGGSAGMPNIDKVPWRQLRGISAHGW